MTPREKIIAVLKGEILDEIPIYRESPMDVTVLEDIIPDLSDGDPEKVMAYTRFFSSCTTFLNIDMEVETLSKDNTHHRYRYETGAVWKESYLPTFCREAEHYPVNTPGEACLFRFSDRGFREGFDKEMAREKIRRFHENGFFVEGGAMGTFHAIYYYITSFENILTWMAVEEKAAEALFRETARYSLESARVLLDCGVDAIFVCSDLGTAISLIFSREMFRKYMAGWLKELADLCHERGAFLHLHSHGHVERLMEDFIGCGVDIINPIGPSDNNDLEYFKREWGNRICFNAGIGTQISQMDEVQMREHVFRVVETGRKGGRFFPRTESGIPPMSREKTLFYLELLREACRMGYAP
ncbi:MAG: uroporphyrinogen decarboxylase family protein [Clostridia bacterium]